MTAVRVAIRRLITALPLLLGVSLAVFVLIDLAPGDAAERVAGDAALDEEIAEIRHELRLDRPLVVRYGSYLADAVQGDLGESLVTKEPVGTLIMERLPVTLSLAGVALVFAIVFGFLLGLVSTFRPYGVVDRVVTLICAVAVATPQFLFGLLLAVYLAINRAWLPATGYSPMADGLWLWLQHLIIPALALAWLPAAEIARQLRGSLLETLDRDYILAAEAKGVRPRKVLLKHALKNAAIPPITVLGFRIAQMVGGTVVIERLFLLPGLGQLTIGAVLSRDYQVILGIVLFLTLVVLLVNLVVDAVYTYFNPKLRVGTR